MHIYFSGIGGTAIGPLALIAQEAGFSVSGSDKQDSAYLEYLRNNGITDIATSQDGSHLAATHEREPVDWFVYSSAVAIENPNSPELQFCRDNGIKATKRDDLLNHIITDKKLQLIAVAGTHGKTTTTAMLIWLFKQLKTPISYSVGAKLSFGDMGHYSLEARYFIYECDEFDRNFLAFHPYLSLITGIDWDHPDIYPTRVDYEMAFSQFVDQSQAVVFWQPDFDKLKLTASDNYVVLDEEDPAVAQLQLIGEVNRQNAWQAMQAVHKLTQTPLDELAEHMNRFPGLSRRFEKLVPHLYTDYAHTPAKIRGALQTAKETSEKVVVIYEGLHNTRQHFIKDELPHLFDGVDQLYIVPSYLAREDPSLPTLSPDDLAKLIAPPTPAQAMQLGDQLKSVIDAHLKDEDLVLCLSAGGGGSLDEWLRKAYK